MDLNRKLDHVNEMRMTPALAIAAQLRMPALLMEQASALRCISHAIILEQSRLRIKKTKDMFRKSSLIHELSRDYVDNLCKKYPTPLEIEQHRALHEIYMQNINARKQLISSHD